MYRAPTGKKDPEHDPDLVGASSDLPRGLRRKREKRTKKIRGHDVSCPYGEERPGARSDLVGASSDLPRGLRRKREKRTKKIRGHDISCPYGREIKKAQEKKR